MLRVGRMTRLATSGTASTADQLRPLDQFALYP